MQNAFAEITSAYTVPNWEHAPEMLLSGVVEIRPVDHAQMGFTTVIPVPAQNVDWRQAFADAVVAQAAVEFPDINLLYIVFPGLSIVEIPQV